MHAQSNTTDPHQCPSCGGTGKTPAAQAAERVLSLSESEQASEFGKLDMYGRSRLLESNRGAYERLRDAEAAR